MVVLAGDDSEAKQVAEDIYAALVDRGVEVLYDDRDETPGVKFADADLIGIPMRLTISARSLQRGGIEMKRRDSKESCIISMDELGERLDRELGALHSEITSRVVEVKYNAEEG